MHACSLGLQLGKLSSHIQEVIHGGLRSGFEGKFSSGLKHGKIKIAKVSQKGRAT
jgi:hypothetical protein